MAALQPALYGQPIGWTGKRHVYHKSAVFPTKSTGAYVNMHNKIKPKFRPRSKWIAETVQKHKVENAEPRQFSAERRNVVKVLQENMLLPGDYSGLWGVPSFKYLQDSVNRLHAPRQRDLLRSSDRLYEDLAEPRRGRSYTSAEVQSVVERLSAYDSQKFPADSRGTKTRRPSKVVKKSYPTTLSKAERAVVDRLASYDKTKWPAGSRTFEKPTPPPKECSEKPAKKFNEVKINEVFTRLSTFDATKYPAESRGVLPNIPPHPEVKASKQVANEEKDNIIDRLSRYDADKLPAESRGTLPKIARHPEVKSGKRVAPEEVQEIVTRLAAYDVTKWPPESRPQIKQ